MLKDYCNNKGVGKCGVEGMSTVKKEIPEPIVMYQEKLVKNNLKNEVKAGSKDACRAFVTAEKNDKSNDHTKKNPENSS